MGQFAGGASLKSPSPTGDTNKDIDLMHNCMALVVGLARGTFADAGVLCLLREAMDKKMIIILAHRGVVFADLFRECPDGLKDMGLMSGIALEWHAGDGGFCDYMQASVKVVIQRLIDELERRRPAISSSILTCLKQPRTGQLTKEKEVAQPVELGSLSLELESTNGSKDQQHVPKGRLFRPTSFLTRAEHDGLH